MVFTEMKVFEFYLNPLSFGRLGPLEVKGSGLLEPPEAILRYRSPNLHPSSLVQTSIYLGVVCLTIIDIDIGTWRSVWLTDMMSDSSQSVTPGVEGGGGGVRRYSA